MTKPKPETIALRELKARIAPLAKLVDDRSDKEFFGMFGTYPGPLNRQLCFTFDGKVFAFSGGGSLTQQEVLILFQAAETIVTARYGAQAPAVDIGEEPEHDAVA